MARQYKSLAYSKRILVFGTFDILHPGHLHFFRQARSLAAKPFLIVSLARGVNVKRIKGVRPRSSESQRLKALKGCLLVDMAVLGASKDYVGHIISLHPDIIALGYDQKAYTEGLASKLAERGLTVRIRRLKAHRPERYKTSLLDPRVKALARKRSGARD